MKEATVISLLDMERTLSVGDSDNAAIVKMLRVISCSANFLEFHVVYEGSEPNKTITYSGDYYIRWGKEDA